MKPTGFPGPIPTDESNVFASHTMRVRVPEILQQTMDANPDWPTSLREAVAGLQAEIAGDAVMQPLKSAETPETQVWQAEYARRAGQTWHATDWFFAETYTYRRLIEAVGYLETRKDPFAPIKRHEYASDQHQSLFDAALAVEGERADVLHRLISADLWGNRVDLSYAESRAQGMETADADLLVDDRAAIIARLGRGAGHVHLVADNAGTELTLDLVLIDALLRDGWAEKVTLHVKYHPTFVSDAIPADVDNFLAACLAGTYGAAAQKMAARLNAARADGRLALENDPYWNSSLFWWDMPAHLLEPLRAASLVFVKGDANYRRVVGDAYWSLETSFEAVVSGVGIPVACIRTLKSDPLVGLEAGVGERLQATDPRWRWSGKRGVIQAYAP